MQQHLTGMRKLPAIPWLSDNKNEGALASNRFGPTENARAFVEQLIQLGALQVYVADPKEEQSRVQLEGGPYADTLIVELPADRQRRQVLFEVFAAESEAQGFEPEVDHGQDEVLLWWD